MKTNIHYLANYLIQDLHPITITLIGAGGNGSYMAHYLGKLHKALTYQGKKGLEITIIDGDIVEENNTMRQLFTPNDVGSYKSIALATQLNRAYSIETTPITTMFDPLHCGITTNFTVICVDTGKAREQIYKMLYKDSKANKNSKNYYVLDLGNTKNSGQVILGTLLNVEQPVSKTYNPVSYLPSLMDIEPNLSKYDNDNVQGPSCSTQLALAEQDLFINAQIALSASQLLWKFLNDSYILSAQIYVNLESGSIISKSI